MHFDLLAINFIDDIGILNLKKAVLGTVFFFPSRIQALSLSTIRF